MCSKDDLSVMPDWLMKRAREAEESLRTYREAGLIPHLTCDGTGGWVWYTNSDRFKSDADYEDYGLWK
jgi:hypothetical protein